MDEHASGDLSSFSSTSSFATNKPATPTNGRSVSNLRPLPEEVDSPIDVNEGGALCVVSLNLGGRNTNPVEFVLKGDSSETAVDAMAVLRRAGKAMRSAEQGPLLMPSSEMDLVQEIVTLIFQDDPESEWHSRTLQLFRCETWRHVIASVQATNPHAFNAFNLSTLKLNRPSVWENPASCKDFSNTKEYLAAWKQWFLGLDRAGQFWSEDAPRVAKKRGMEVPLAFAGLFLFDVMCLCTARCSLVSASEDLDDVAEDARAVPFKELAGFAAKLPASSLSARHTCAQRFTEGAHAILAQEARSFAEHPAISEAFLPPFSAQDGFTAVFLRKDSFIKARDISSEVMERMEERIDVTASHESQRAWRTTGSRLAAVFCHGTPELGGFRACFVSLHVSKSDCTAAFIEKLREVLEDYDADINVVGMDSNCAGKETAAFQKRLWAAGFEIGCSSRQQQVTVAKQRTPFQTQIQKIGDIDISHKDYIVSWASSRVARGRTTYTPDLRTCYGVEQETKQCMRLPTTKWPFDHCGVATFFRKKSRCKGSVGCSGRLLRSCVLALLLLLLFAAPFASGARKSPYGPPGAWFQDAWLFTPRLGICEVAAPCPDDTWLQDGDSCYITTGQKLAYPEVQSFCEDLHANATPIAIGSEAENELVLRSLCPKGDFCYIGLHVDYTQPTYWVSGEAYNYTRLVETGTSSQSLAGKSRSTEFAATIITNLQGEVQGCHAHFASTQLQSRSSAFGTFLTFGAPSFAVLLSGGLLALPRPPRQRLACSLLFLAFVVNYLWLWQRFLNACFVEDYTTRLSVRKYGNTVDFMGHTGTSLLSLWMIVRRMCMLYPAKVLKRIFWTLIASILLLFLVSSTFVDGSAPMAATWAVLLMLSNQVLVILLYLMASLLISLHLYRTWACLHREATNGCNDHGTRLSQSVRAAKLHFFTVCFAITTGALRWAALLGNMIGLMHPDSPVLALGNAYVLCTLVDSLTNDLCAHLFACVNMDAAVGRQRGVTEEVAERAERELEQHRIAVRMLKAAPTSCEQMQQLASLEHKAKAAFGTEQEKSAFLILQSAVRVETARIHKLMQCVRVRAMTMGLRYQYLIEVPGLDNAPRQYVPEEFSSVREAVSSPSDADSMAESKYFNWLYAEAGGAQTVLFQQLQRLLAKFNTTDWPSDLGLAPEEFPWRIWAGSNGQGASMKRLQSGEHIRPGDTLIHSPKKRTALTRAPPPSLCIVLEETSPKTTSIHCSGMEAAQEVPRDQLRTCRGGCVFIPGPQKKRERCIDKITADYEGSVPFPAAASLVDICRCTLLCDDPYAVAVLVAYIRKNMEVVRVKNRFNEDVLESRGAEDLQSIFNAASDATASDTMTNVSFAYTSSGDQQYRDISMNVAVKTPHGVPFICEIQVTLSNLAILKKADQKLYTLRRMKTPGELYNTSVFMGAAGSTSKP